MSRRVRDPGPPRPPHPDVRAILDGLRFVRFVPRGALPSLKNESGTRLCGWCREPLTGRRTSWCSDACADEFWIRFSSSAVLPRVRRRDRGRCALCGATDGAWEADHIMPVVEGGGCCGLDGYRTLCVPCHRDQTAALAARRATAKRRAVATRLDVLGSAA